MNMRMQEEFVKVLETDSVTDVALIRSALDGEKITYFLQGEKLIRRLDPFVLMVASGDLERAVMLLRPLKLNYSPLSFPEKKQ
jgi:hypothetical protein